MDYENRPRVTIGVPVYNGERFLAATLDSIISQTSRDIEIVICDNASTDGTAAICREYVRRDSRVRYYRNTTNIGPAPNYNRTLALATGDVFKLAGADDLLAPTFVERCLELLDADERNVVTYPLTKRINDDGEVFGEWDVELDLMHNSPAVRLWRFLFANHRRHNAAEGWGLVRMDVARSFAPFLGSFPSADRVLMTNLVLRGKVARVEEPLFFDREHTGRSGRALTRQSIRPGSRLVKYIGAGPMPAYEWWDASRKGQIVFPEWRWLGGYWHAVAIAPITTTQRLACFVVVAMLSIKFFPRLVRDVLIGTEQFINRHLGTEPKLATDLPAPVAPRRFVFGRSCPSPAPVQILREEKPEVLDSTVESAAGE